MPAAPSLANSIAMAFPISPLAPVIRENFPESLDDIGDRSEVLRINLRMGACALHALQESRVTRPSRRNRLCIRNTYILMFHTNMHRMGGEVERVYLDSIQIGSWISSSTG